MATWNAFDLKNYDPMLVMIAVAVAIGFSLFQVWQDKSQKAKLKPLKKKKFAFEKLEKHTPEFQNPEVITVCKGQIHVAIGYGLANAIVIEGQNSCVLIDTMEGQEAAKNALDALKKVIKDKPIEAIILTHFHADHTYGLEVFTKAYPDAKVFAHDTLKFYFQQLQNVRSQITFKRAAFQFGTQLDDEEHENSGIGIKLNLSKLMNNPDMNPDRTFKDKLEVNLAGHDLVLYHAPGETNDQIIVHWPAENVVFPADNLYRAFPNLYAIRGTMSRDTLQWVKAVDLMRKLKPKLLVPQHTRPIEGSAEINEILTSYRDAIQIVHDQTVRYMNKGLFPDEITRKVTLPPHLADHPFLQEFYGTVEWSVKGVFCTYMGWFSGKASELHPMERIEHSMAMMDLAGGPEKMEQKMKEVFFEGKYRWALELADAMIDTRNYEKSARTVKINALRQLALDEVSACGRNWYLTEALCEDGLELKPTDQMRKNRIYSGPLYDLFLLLTVMVDLEKTVNVVETACFRFKDTNQVFVLKLRKGVLELLTEEEDDKNYDLEVTTDEKTWREIMAKDTSAAIAVLKKKIEVRPRLLKLAEFMGYFDTGA